MLKTNIDLNIKSILHNSSDAIRTDESYRHSIDTSEVSKLSQLICSHQLCGSCCKDFEAELLAQIRQPRLLPNCQIHLLAKHKLIVTMYKKLKTNKAKSPPLLFI